MRLRTFTLFSLLIAVVLVLLGINQPTQAANANSGFVRVIHASPDAGAVDIYVDGKLAIPGLAFGKATDFMAMAAKIYKVEVRTAGAKATDKAVVTSTITVTKGELLNVVALGEAAGKGVAALRLATFPAYSKDLGGKAALDVIHAVPDGPAIDVLSGVRPVVKNVAFGKAGKTWVVDAGKWFLAVVPTGKTSPILVDMPSTTLDADMITTIVIGGTVKDKSVKVWTFTHQPLSILEKATPAATMAGTSMAAAPAATTAGTSMAAATAAPTMAATK